MIKELPFGATRVDEQGIVHPNPGFEEIFENGDMNALHPDIKVKFNSFTDEKIDQVLSSEEDEYDPEAGDITL